MNMRSNELTAEKINLRKHCCSDLLRGQLVTNTRTRSVAIIADAVCMRYGSRLIKTITTTVDAISENKIKPRDP